VEQDSSSLYYIARALTSLQQLSGAIPHVKGKGEAAAAVQRIAARMRQELGKDAPAAAGAPVSRCPACRPQPHQNVSVRAHAPAMSLLPTLDHTRSQAPCASTRSHC
jgi:hypothetical protein